MGSYITPKRRWHWSGHPSKSRSIRNLGAPDLGGRDRIHVRGEPTYAAMTEDTSALLRVLDVGSVDIVGWSDGVSLP